MSSLDDDAAIHALADAIRQYVQAHPGAADEVQGIRNWWLPSQLADESPAALQRALDGLVAEGLLKRRVQRDRRVSYRCPPKGVSMETHAAATLTLQIGAGPAVGVSWHIEADVFHRATLKVPANKSVEVPLQAGGGEKILFLLISASKFSDKLTYRLDANHPDFKLAYPQIVSGGDLMHHVSKRPAHVTFKNASADDVTVDVIALRKA